MEYGIGLDTTLNISYEQDLHISKYAVEQGYTSIQTPESNRYDSSAILSKVNFWKPNLIKYPLFKKAQFIEIILHPGKMFYIPAYWWYAIENITTSIMISIKTENIFSSIDKIPTLIKSLYHLNGKYKKNNCTCHNYLK